jgi:dihydrofolate reductase
MRKIRIIEHISLDGVIQAPGELDEDRDGDFERGGWIVPHSDPAVGEAIHVGHGKAFDLLLGRRTYDIWSGYWPMIKNDLMADSLDAATKFVATHRPDSLGWGSVEDLGADIIERVRGVKSKDGQACDGGDDDDEENRHRGAGSGSSRLTRPRQRRLGELNGWR